ncbi:DUF5689 domain-containing protein [Flavobacterium sp. JP2137]|uniref:DUF5689 domain-containing protein n=1 Tax=Flavobacterium sp. JP2137 TaxID=3414510 RepID=UPI003D2FD71F
MNYPTLNKAPLVALLLLCAACVKTDGFELPNTDCIEPHIQATKSVESLAEFATNSAQRYAAQDVISGWVLSSDRERHFANSLYLLSENRQTAFKIAAESTGLGHYTRTPVGTKVYVQLENLYIQQQNGLLVLGDVFDEKMGTISKVLLHKHLIPTCQQINEAELISELTLVEVLDSEKYLGKLVALGEVQFVDSAVGLPYNQEGSTATQRQLTDRAGNTLGVRTQKQALYSTDLIPSNSGKITGILTPMGYSYQLTVRFERDIQLTEPRFETPVEASP